MSLGNLSTGSALRGLSGSKGSTLQWTNGRRPTFFLILSSFDGADANVLQTARLALQTASSTA